MPATDDRGEQVVEGLAEPGLVEVLHDALARLWLLVPDVPAGDRMRFETAVVEVATNIVRHTVPVDGPVEASARLWATHDALEAELSDTGAEVEVDLDREAVDDLAVGGRGIALVQRAVDSLTLSREGSRNVWRLTRRLGSG